MTAAVSRNVTSSLPGTQASAPVLSFTCLYTRDSHKKAKKWHDGIVKYHTFNKRVMVYEDSHSGTFVGDVHWRGEEDIQEGEELRLERGGVVVEVGESKGREDTDLSQLRQAKKTADGPGQDGARATPGATGQRRVTTQNGTRVPLRGKHRSLNALLGTPKGRLGKATLPTKSPFEERHAVENEEWEDDRPTKRARTAGSAPGWSVTRTSTTSAPERKDETPLWARTADSAKKEKRRKKHDALPPGQQKLGQKVVIDLEDDVNSSNNFLPGLSDALLAPSSPVRQGTAVANGRGHRSSSPVPHARNTAAAQRKQDGNAERMAKSRDTENRPLSARETPRPVVRPHAADDGRSRQMLSPKLSRTASLSTGQTLRFAASVPKKRTLLCQDQLTNKPKRISSTNTDDAADSLLGSMEIDDEPQRPKTADERLAARLKRIEQKKGSTSTSKSQAASVAAAKEPEPVVIVDDEDESAKHNDESSDTIVGEAPRRNLTTLEASAIELARLDQMMLPPPAPRAPAPARAATLAHPESALTKPPSRAAPKSPEEEVASRTYSKAATKRSTPPPPREKGPLRRVVSESNQPQPPTRRTPGAPVRYTPTPSPTKRSRESTPSAPIGGAAAKTPADSVPPDLAPIAKAAPATKSLAAKPPPQPAQALEQSKARPAPAPERPAPFRNNKPKKPLQKSVSLNIASTGTSTVILNRPFHRPGKPASPKEPDKEEDKDLGPWSREAFDLFAEKWRPPGWNEEKWCLQDKQHDENTAVTS
ncbi:hypothetical protein TI39_contig5832g00039 [Zymoseptoria brevis]|uniref:5'-3' DNA helicase ZGRF1-like N-terminal domain-containing protein n=1 Tax=Zymoseptoria brevis TaxID=1047168 RepID=A0A0F4G8U7_9PEZI|nr:hypothetical protein TI39_contig5832g00039 [Zymoseptoria brevis]